MNHSEKFIKFLSYVKTKSTIKTKIKNFGEQNFNELVPFFLNDKMIKALDLDKQEIIEYKENVLVNENKSAFYKSIKNKLDFAKYLNLTEESFYKVYLDYLKSFLK